MRLDRYEDPKNFPTAPRYKVQRRQPDGSYVDVDPAECFILKARDSHALRAIVAYAVGANHNDKELAADVLRLAEEWSLREDVKNPD